MAFKRYPLRYVKTYRYENPESKEVDEIVFMANGYLFPLFKSLTGVELGNAIADYKKGLLDLVDNDLVEVITKYEGAQTAEDKLKVLAEKPEVVFSALRAAQDTNAICGLSLIDLLLVIMRVCALPESDHAEALAAGAEILPQECFEDPQLALELLMLAIQYDDNAKKKLKLPSTIRKNPEIKRFGTTSYILYSLAQLGFQVDILKYGMNVIMDVVNLAIALHEDDKAGDPSGDYIDLSDEPVDDTEG